MSHLSNYPTGASCDPSAPFNQPMREPMFDDEVAWCEVRHNPGETCGRYGTHRCRCGVDCCAEAMVRVRNVWGGKRHEELVCCECAREEMAPCDADAAVAYLNRAVDHAMAAPIPMDDRLDRADVFMRAMGEMAGEVGRQRHEASLAILNFGRVA